MRLLLDTHVVIWAAKEPARLPPDVAKKLEDPANSLHVSVVSSYEISIKRGTRRLAFPPLDAERVRRMRMDSLPVGLDHALETEKLPLLHRDPFDRLLVAQARVEGLVLVSKDRHVRQYDVQTLWD